MDTHMFASILKSQFARSERQLQCLFVYSQANTETFIGDMDNSPRNNFRVTLPSLQGASVAIVYYQLKTSGQPDRKVGVNPLW